MPSKTQLLKIILTIMIFSLIFYIIHYHLEIRPMDIREFILSLGIWGPSVFILLYLIGPLVFLPTSVLSLGAGMAFGVWPGILYILLGATGAAMTGYIMGRLFGTSILKVQRYAWSKKLFEQVEKHSFLYVFILRLIPIISFDLLSYAGGITKVRFKFFIFATFFGMIPGTFAYTFLGSSIVSGDITIIIVAIGVFLSIIGLTYIFRNPVKRWLGLSSK